MMNKKAVNYLGAVAIVALAGCSASSKLVKQADKKFYKEGAYETAAQLYQQALSRGANPSYVNAQIGEAYRLSNRERQAEPFYKAAIDAGNSTDSIRFAHGFALKHAGKYQEAEQALQQYASSGNDQKRIERAKREVANLKKIQDIANKKTAFNVENFSALNTEAAEFSPVLKGGEELYFTSNRGASLTYAGTGTGFTDIYVYRFDGSTPTSGQATAMPGAVNSNNTHEAQVAFSKDGKSMVFARSNDGSRKGAKNVDLFLSRFKDGSWSDPELLPISHPTAWDACPAFSADGRSLYFSSDRPGGEGGSDIYRATQDANGRFTKVQNMGKDINTPGEEQYPYVSADGKLFFASDGHPSLGGLDIFVATRTANGIGIENMGVPINSLGDDFGLVWKDEASGYLSSNREGGKGDDDIYTFRDTDKDVRIVHFELAGMVYGTDGKNTNPLPNAHVRVLDDKNQMISEATADEQGRFKVKLEPDQSYTIISDKGGYLTKRESYTTNGKTPPKEQLTQRETTIPLETSITLDQVKVGTKFEVKNIFYEYAKADITAESGTELDKLVSFMQDNPGLKVELSAHTDSRGKADYNQRLSQRRAESAVRYMVQHGVDSTKIVAKGYGAAQPVVKKAKTEEEHARNRRTEFKILGVDPNADLKIIDNNAKPEGQEGQNQQTQPAGQGGQSPQTQPAGEGTKQE